MKITIDVETKTFIRFGLVVLGFAALISGVFLARSALLLIGIALFLALALNPPVSWLAKKLPGKSRVGATGIAYLLVVTTLGLLIFLIAPPIIEQTAKFTKTLPELVDKVVAQRGVLDGFLDQYGLRDGFNQAVENVKNNAVNASEQIGGILLALASGAVTGLVNLILVLVLGFFMLVEGPYWMRKIWELYDDSEKMERHKATVTKMYRVVTGFVNGQLVVAGIGAAFSGAALFIMSLIPDLNVPANLALPLAVLVFLTALIPMVGTTIGGVLAALVLLLNSPWAALIFIIFFVVYQQIENNVIAPPIQSKTVDLSVLWVLVAILIGASLFGLIGGLVSIPIAGSLRVLLVDYLDNAKRKRAQTEKKNPLSKLVSKIKNSSKT